MELELKHLAHYLPFGFKVLRAYNKEIMLLNGISAPYTIEAVELYNYENCALLAFGGGKIDEYDDFKPILRPLSDLTKEIEHNGEKFVPYIKLYNDYPRLTKSEIGFLNDLIDKTLEIEYRIVQKLLEWHFDIHNLIENGLAININTLNK